MVKPSRSLFNWFIWHSTEDHVSLLCIETLNSRNILILEFRALILHVIGLSFLDHSSGRSESSGECSVEVTISDGNDETI